MASAAYERECLLGTGGMAEVWLARAPSGRVALKCLLPHAARNPSIAAAFEREGRLLQRIHHPNVVAIHEILHADQGPLLVLEYVEGVDLRAMSKAGAPLRVVLRVVREVLRALEAVHGLCDDKGHRVGLIHRDLSPSNVLISIEGGVKLTDFGIARALTGTHATTGIQIKGTLAYLSPEQASGAPTDARSDLFSVGALLFELLAGVPIYNEDDPRLALARARAGDVHSVAEHRPDLPPAVTEFVDRALSARPGDRYPSAVAMGAEIERIAADVGGLASESELAAWAQTAYRLKERAEPSGVGASQRGPGPSAASQPDPQPPVRVPAGTWRKHARFFSSRSRVGLLGLGAALTLPGIWATWPLWAPTRPAETRRMASALVVSPAAAPLSAAPGVIGPALAERSGPQAATLGALTPERADPSEGPLPPDNSAGALTAPPASGSPLPSNERQPASPAAPSFRSGRRASNGASASVSPHAATAATSTRALLDLGSEPGFAYVTIDGVRIGATPLFGYELSSGVHRIEVSREGLGSKSFTLDVRSGERIRKVVKLR